MKSKLLERDVTPAQHKALLRLAGDDTVALRLRRRAQAVVLASQGFKSREIAAELGITFQGVAWTMAVWNAKGMASVKLPDPQHEPQVLVVDAADTVVRIGDGLTVAVE